MKVLQINSVYAYGSTGRIAQSLKNVIEARGWEGAVIYGRGQSSDESLVWKIGSDIDFKTHVLLARLTDRSGFFSKKNTMKVITKISQYNPDIIHLHNIHGYYINVGILFDFLKECNKPVVWTLHDCWPFTGHCAYYDSLQCFKWESECNNCPGIADYPKSFVDASRTNFYAKQKLFSGVPNLHLVTPSQWLAGEVKRSFLSDYPCHVIANGIDLGLFRGKQSQQIEKDERKVILGVASEWTERKGFADFIALSNRINHKKMKIVMVGVTSQQKNELERYGIQGVEKTNGIDELVKFYQSASIFFNPTYDDNFPTTNLEALACGTPVLTYKTGGSPESLTSSCGIVVEKGDLDAVIQHLDIWEQYGFKVEDCLLRARQFDKQIKFGEYCQLYERIL